MSFKRIIPLCLAWLLPMTAISQNRERLSLDADWRFHRGEIAGAEIENGTVINGWRWKDAGKTKPTDEKMTLPGLKTTGPEWKNAANGQDVFNNRSEER